MEIADQYYWLGYAKRQIDGTAQGLTDAAAKVSTLVATFWGLYTAAFTIGVSFKKLDEGLLVMFLLVLPIPLLIFSYMAALWAQIRELNLKGVDPRVPDDVMKHYNETIKNKKGRLAVSLIVFFAAGLSLTYALVKANFTHEKKDIKHLIVILSSGKNIFISGDVPTKTMIRYTVKTAKLAATDSTLITANDHFDKTVKAPVNTAYAVLLTWKDLTDTSVVYSYSKFFPLLKITESKTGKLPAK